MDIVDENDMVIAQAPREDIYTYKLLHRIVHILIFNDKGEIGLQLRSKSVSYCPNHWSTSVGGHPEAGEKPKQSALREYQEELASTTPIVFWKKAFYSPKVGLDKILYVFKTKSQGKEKPTKEVEKIDFFTIP